MTNQLKFIDKSNIKHFKKAKFTMVIDDLFYVYGLKPNEAMVYSRLLDRLSLSAKHLNDFSDNLGVYVKYDQTKLGKSINLTKGTVDNAMKKLRDKKLIWYYQEKKGMANKIYFIPLEIHNSYIADDDIADDMGDNDSVDYTQDNSPMSTSQNFELPTSTNFTLADSSSTNFSNCSSTNFVSETDLSLKPYLRDIISKTLLEFSNNISQSFNSVSNRLNTLESFQSQVLNELKTQIIAELKPRMDQAVNDGLSDSSYDVNEIADYFKDQVCYDALLQEVSIGDKGLVDDMVMAMAAMYGIDKGVKVKGNYYPKQVVQSLLHRFNFNCALNVIKNIKDYACGKQITDTFSFLKSSIINECLIHNFSAEKDFLFEQHQDYSSGIYAPKYHEHDDNQQVQSDWDALLSTF